MSSPAPAQAPAPRIQSVDALRGAIMIIMAIDHIRDYVDRSSMQFLPTDLTQTTIPLFLTRWITHFCAPTFMLTAGMGAFLWMARGHRTKAELSRFLLTRGLWLIFFEATVMRAVVFFDVQILHPTIIWIILFAFGFSMIALAALCHLPTRAIAAIGIAFIALHNLLDPVQPASFGHFAWLVTLFHQPGLIRLGGTKFIIGYPVLPWIGVVSCGYALGTVYTWDAARRQRFLMRLGLALISAFVIVRAINIYGDPAPWSHQSTAAFTPFSRSSTASSTRRLSISC